VVSENGPFLSGVRHFGGGEARLYGYRINGGGPLFEWWEAQSTFHTWLRFNLDLLKRFEPGTTSNPLVPLLQVKQTSSVMEYRRDFELAARSHRNLGGETLLCMFHEGLKLTIKSKLVVVEFESLDGSCNGCRSEKLSLARRGWKPMGKTT